MSAEDGASRVRLPAARSGADQVRLLAALKYGSREADRDNASRLRILRQMHLRRETVIGIDHADGLDVAVAVTPDADGRLIVRLLKRSNV